MYLLGWCSIRTHNGRLLVCLFCLFVCLLLVCLFVCLFVCLLVFLFVSFFLSDLFWSILLASGFQFPLAFLFTIICMALCLHNAK